MARNRASKPKRAPPTNTVELRERMPSGRTPTRTSAHEPAAAPFDTDDEAAGRPASRAAIEQTVVHENAQAQRDVRAARSRGAVGPVGKTVLIIALFALVALIAVWLMLMA